MFFSQMRCGITTLHSFCSKCVPFCLGPRFAWGSVNKVESSEILEQTFFSTGLIYNFLYHPTEKYATTDFHLLHQFIFSAFFMIIEIFCTGIPIRIYHVIYRTGFNFSNSFLATSPTDEVSLKLSCCWTLLWLTLHEEPWWNNQVSSFLSRWKSV